MPEQFSYIAIDLDSVSVNGDTVSMKLGHETREYNFTSADSMGKFLRSIVRETPWVPIYDEQGIQRNPKAYKLS